MPKEEPKTCFVVMPISDVDGYEEGHFTRVYDYLMRPACQEAGFTPVRADDVKNTNFIVLDILKRVITADIVVCDLSAKNPNVLYELGIRQAFDLPVVLVKDSRTERIFDIQGIRTLDYDDALRVDVVKRDVQALGKAISETASRHEKDGSSLIRLLSLQKAELGSGGDVSSDTSVVLSALQDISMRITGLESRYDQAMGPRVRPRVRLPPKLKLPNGEPATIGDEIYDGSNNLETLGILVDIDSEKVIIKGESGYELVSADSEIYEHLTQLPF